MIETNEKEKSAGGADSGRPESIERFVLKGMVKLAHSLEERNKKIELAADKLRKLDPKRYSML